MCRKELRKGIALFWKPFPFSFSRSVLWGSTLSIQSDDGPCPRASSTFRCLAATVRRRPKASDTPTVCTKADSRGIGALIRSAAEAKIREADRLECEAWNATMWAGGPFTFLNCSSQPRHLSR